MGANQRMAHQEAGWLLDSQVHSEFRDPIQGLFQGAIHQRRNHQGTGRRGLQAAQGGL